MTLAYQALIPKKLEHESFWLAIANWMTQFPIQSKGQNCLWSRQHGHIPRVVYSSRHSTSIQICRDSLCKNWSKWCVACHCADWKHDIFTGELNFTNFVNPTHKIAPIWKLTAPHLSLSSHLQASQSYLAPQYLLLVICFKQPVNIAPKLSRLLRIHRIMFLPPTKTPTLEKRSILLLNRLSRSPGGILNWVPCSQVIIIPDQSTLVIDRCSNFVAQQNYWIVCPLHNITQLMSNVLDIQE